MRNENSELQEIVEEPIILEYAPLPKKSNLKRNLVIGGVVAGTIATFYVAYKVYEVYEGLSGIGNIGSFSFF